MTSATRASDETKETGTIDVPVRFLQDRQKVLKMNRTATVKDIRIAAAAAYSWTNDDLIVQDLAGIRKDTTPVMTLMYSVDFPLAIDAYIDITIKFQGDEQEEEQLALSVSTLTLVGQLREILQLKFAVSSKEFVIRACGRQISNDSLPLEWLYRGENMTDRKKSPVITVRLCQHKLPVSLGKDGPNLTCFVTYKNKLSDVRKQIRQQSFLRGVGFTGDGYVFHFAGKLLSDDCTVQKEWYNDTSSAFFSPLVFTFQECL